MKYKTIETFSFMLLLALSFVGLVIVNITVHEVIHQDDYKSIEKFNDSICLLSLGNDYAGYYKYTPLPNQTEELAAIDKYTEWRAYSGSIIVYLIGTVVILIAVWGWLKEHYGWKDERD